MRISLPSFALVVAAVLGGARSPAAAEVDAAGLFEQVHRLNQLMSDAADVADENAFRRKIRQFGETLRAEHEEMEARLRVVASARGVALDRLRPEGALQRFRAARDRSTLGHLASKRGWAFERDYLRLVERTHKDVLASLADVRDRVEDPAVRRWVEETIQALERHIAATGSLLYEEPHPKRTG